MIGNWKSTTIPENTEAERKILEGVLDAIGKGDAVSEGFKAKGGRGGGGSSGGGGGGGSKKGSKKGNMSSGPPSKYSQPGRYALLKWKQKANRDRPPSAY